MTLIAIISDTHMPKGERALPLACLRRLERAELIVHAGDFVRADVLERLEELGPVAAVHGNVDEAALQQRLPAELSIPTPEGPTLAVTHDAGPRTGRLARLRARFRQADAVVFGHSHLPWHERDQPDGFQIFNPGSPTERRRAPEHTMGMAHVDAGGIRLELVRLD